MCLEDDLKREQKEEKEEEEAEEKKRRRRRRGRRGRRRRRREFGFGMLIFSYLQNFLAKTSSGELVIPV